MKNKYVQTILIVLLAVNILFISNTSASENEIDPGPIYKVILKEEMENTYNLETNK